MPVSSGLQQYFDKTRGKRRKSIQKTLKSLENEIDPKFLQCFEDFHTRILGIVDENSENADVVENELGKLDDSLKERKRVHQMKKAASIIDIVA